MAAKIGLTGGIGSGKSSVSACFAELGVQVIDADQVGRQLSEPGSPQFEEIIECFGAKIVDSNGQLNRKQLGNIVFNSPDKRKLLESILHPPIRAEMFARAEADSGVYCILDVPLLIENSLYKEVDRVVVVSCSTELRSQRLQLQRGMQPEEIKQVMENQLSEEERLAVADDVINNYGTIEEVKLQVLKLHQTYLKQFA